MDGLRHKQKFIEFTLYYESFWWQTGVFVICLNFVVNKVIFVLIAETWKKAEFYINTLQDIQTDSVTQFWEHRKRKTMGVSNTIFPFSIEKQTNKLNNSTCLLKTKLIIYRLNCGICNAVETSLCIFLIQKQQKNSFESKTK